MRDGLYQVTKPYLCAGFVVRGRRIIMCAPILRKSMIYWVSIARRICD
jgi:hypothetical protein